ncbi:hypothetical protein [Natranaerobius thermophilus]|uniref:Uncharacterized protein n=1 Tax=Natranaerobius thermophilus (strain ATCC BAA-1301 / DSM 18059 / JW/NM-WN-LF) TaxID=457570 RepID=B2A5B5_NATTJ|nr:hypothetical protein [Natranaerobius thermophilus]ACB83949.1 hypothetical protein Nther_0352 [Natranaerobius thermophilus JW/NM-WN-LF]
MYDMYKKPLILLGFILLLLITGLVIPIEETSEADSDDDYLTIKEINKIAEEKAEKYSDYDVLELATKDEYKGLDTSIEFNDNIHNNREYWINYHLKAHDYGAKYAPNEEEIKKNLFIMDLLDLELRLPQTKYDTVTPGIDYEEYQHFRNYLPDEFDADKIKREENKQYVEEITKTKEYLKNSSIFDFRSRSFELLGDSSTITWKLKEHFSDEKSQVNFMTTPDLMNFISKDNTMSLKTIAGYIIIKTSDEDNKFDVPADERPYKVPVHVYLESKSNEEQEKIIEENDVGFWDISLYAHKFNKISHLEIIDNEHLSTEKVDCKRTIEYYFPYEKMEQIGYEEIIPKLRRTPRYMNNSSPNHYHAIKPFRWHEQRPHVLYHVYEDITPSYIEIDDPDVLNEMFFY